jgi:hypothetical protein
MHSFRFGVGIILSLIASVAFSEDAVVNPSVIKVSPPRGFCELNKASTTENAVLDIFSNYIKVAGFSPVALYPDCRELEESRKSGTLVLTKVAFASFVNRTDKPSSQFIAEACDELKKGVSDEQKARMSRAVTEFSKGYSSVQNTLPLGVLDEVRGTVCYYGQLIRVKIANANAVTLVYLTAGTFAGDQPISIIQWTSFVDQTSIAAALSNLKTIYSDFALANGKSP